MAIAGLLAATFFDEMPAEQRYINHIANISTRIQRLCQKLTCVNEIALCNKIIRVPVQSYKCSCIVKCTHVVSLTRQAECVQGPIASSSSLLMLTITVLLIDCYCCCYCCCARRTRSRTLSEAAVSSRDRIGSTSGHGPSNANNSSGGNSRADNNSSSSSSRDGKKPKGKRRKRRQLKVRSTHCTVRIKA
jgi:hypothetical protein